jgi:hypothetical protein
MDDVLNGQLISAAWEGNTLRCLELLDAKAFIDARSKPHLFTSLGSELPHAGHHDTVMALLEAKASVHLRDNYQTTCLHIAAYFVNVSLCRAMLAYNAGSRH